MCVFACVLPQPVERQLKAPAPLIIPKELQRALPFKDKPKVARKVKDPRQSKRVAMVREPHERKVRRIWMHRNQVMSSHRRQ